MSHTAESDITDSTEKTKAPRSTLVSRNVTIAEHRTSVRLEPEMWSGLSEICRRERGSLHEVCTYVAARKLENTSLTAAIRVFVMSYFRAGATEEGHVKAGHGHSQTVGAAAVTGGAMPHMTSGNYGANGLSATSFSMSARMDDSTPVRDF